MAKPVAPQDMFDMWQKMVNPGGYPLQSLMFPVLDSEEIEKKISELEVVEHWLKANLNMLGLTIKSLQFQRAMLKGGQKFRAEMASGNESGKAAPGDPLSEAAHENPAMWAWNMMARADGNAAKPAAAKTRKKRAHRGS